MSELKRNVKDSLFTYLFKQPEYAKQLYLALHPEDTNVQDEDFKFVTLENVLSIGQYNDLGLQIKNRLILLMEAQSTFCHNIPLRMLMYLANTYKEYVEENRLSLYREKPVSVPRPELYMVYTGAKEEIPDVLYFSNLYDGRGAVELEVKVLRNDGSGNIVDQYIVFCEILAEQVKLYGRTDEALQNTINICLKRGILVPFLNSRMKEVVDIMTTLFDQEKVWEIERYNIAKENREEGRQEGREEGMALGAEKERQKMLHQMLEHMSILDISRITGYSPEEIERLTKS